MLKFLVPQQTRGIEWKLFVLHNSWVRRNSRRRVVLSFWQIIHNCNRCSNSQHYILLSLVNNVRPRASSKNDCLVHHAMKPSSGHVRIQLGRCDLMKTTEMDLRDLDYITRVNNCLTCFQITVGFSTRVKVSSRRRNSERKPVKVSPNCLGC